MPSRRLHSRSVVNALAMLCVLAACGDDPAGDDRAEAELAPPRNVLLISIDTLRADRLGCYGYGRDTSPAMDALARDGVLFRDVTAPSPWTLPSHASLMTGLYPSRHGATGETAGLAEESTVLAELLSAQGLATQAIVNSFYLSKRYGFGQGFDGFRYVSEWEGGHRRSNQSPGKQTSAHAAGEITDRAMTWMETQGDAPFFLFVHYYDVHTDLTPAAEHLETVMASGPGPRPGPSPSPSPGVDPGSAPYAGSVDGTTEQLITLREQGTQLPARDLARLNALYDAEIRQLDAELSRLFAWLDSAGLTDETLVVLTSDHGEEFAEHGSYLHGRTHYQELVAVPLILRGPGIPRGLELEQPVSLVDIAPTILGLFGTAVDQADGLDLGPLWTGAGAFPGQRTLFSEADHNNELPDMKRMIRVGPHKLLLDRSTGAMELYDLSRDPGERVDLGMRETKRRDFLAQQLALFIGDGGAGASLPELSEEQLEQLKALGY